MLKNSKLALEKCEVMLLLLCFFTCLLGAMLIPVEQCPDEAGRALLSQWMVQNHSLPTGNENGTMIMNWGALNAGDMTARHWGFSYALRPFLASIVGALFQSFFRCLPVSQLFYWRRPVCAVFFLLRCAVGSAFVWDIGAFPAVTAAFCLLHLCVFCPRCSFWVCIRTTMPFLFVR